MAVPDSILIVRLGAIGDVTNALVLATALKDAAPTARIGWAVHPLARPLVEGHPAVDRVHVWAREAGWGAAWREWRRLVREVRAEGYALAVDLQRIAKSAALSRASAAPRVLGYDRGRAKELSWLLTRERVAPGPRHAHMLEQVLEFAAHLGLEGVVPRRVLPRDAAAAAWVERTVAELGGPPILVNLGASKPANRWPPERFGRVAAACRARFGPVALTGGPGDRVAAQRALAAAGPGVADLVGCTDLRQLYHLMDRAALFVGCDTGPMHLAAARELPVVAIFGPADPRRTGPWGEGHRVLRAPSAGARGGGRPPRTADVSEEDVLEAVAAGLAREVSSD